MSITWDQFRKMILTEYKEQRDDFPFSLGHWEGEKMDSRFVADYRIDLGQFRRNEYGGTGVDSEANASLPGF